MRRESFAVLCGNGEVSTNEAWGDVFSLAVMKGFIDGISIGRKEEDVQAILAETPNVDPATPATFMEKYEALFD
ncbi:hypothetical protein Tco_0530156 [Tanacetum coccineum]